MFFVTKIATYLLTFLYMNHLCYVWCCCWLKGNWVFLEMLLKRNSSVSRQVWRNGSPNLSLNRSRHRTCIGALFERTSRNSNSGSVIPAQKWILLLDCAKKHNVSVFARHKLDEKINNGRHIRVAFVSVSKRVFVRNYSCFHSFDVCDDSLIIIFTVIDVCIDVHV